MSYFDRLQHDMIQLGVVHDDRTPETYQQLVQLVDTASGKDNFDPEVAADLDPSALQTRFARYALQLYHDDLLLSDIDQTIRDKKKYGICNMAEHRLVDALRPDTLRNPTVDSAVIVTESGSPVGIMPHSRNARRMLYYALHDDEASRTHAGCFYQIPLSTARFTEALKTDRAWTMPVHEIAGRPDDGRLSIFTMPTFERRKLAVDDAVERPGLERSHQSLAAWACRALDTAQPIAIKKDQ